MERARARGPAATRAARVVRPPEVADGADLRAVRHLGDSDAEDVAAARAAGLTGVRGDRSTGRDLLTYAKKSAASAY